MLVWLERLLPLAILALMIGAIVWGRRKGIDRHAADMRVAAAGGAAEMAAHLGQVVNVSVGNVNSPGALQSDGASSEHEALSRSASARYGLPAPASDLFFQQLGKRLDPADDHDPPDHYLDVGTLRHISAGYRSGDTARSGDGDAGDRWSGAGGVSDGPEVTS